MKFIRSENTGNTNQLVIVVFSGEKGFFLEDLEDKEKQKEYAYHCGEHTSKAPHVKRVIVISHINKKFRAFEITRCNSDIVLFASMIKFSETPINKTQFTLLVIDHDIVGFNIAMH